MTDITMLSHIDIITIIIISITIESLSKYISITTPSIIKR